MLLYPVDIKDTYFGQQLHVDRVDLGSAKDFMRWNPEVQTFTIAPGAAIELYVGVHTVCLSVSYSNSTYYEAYDDCFTVTIKPGAATAAAVVNSTFTPPEVVAKPVDQLVISNFGLELGPFNEKQPIPYIRDLTSTGVLVIAWDRLMTQQNDFGVINPSRVAVHNKNSTASDPYGFEQGQNGRRLNVRFYDKLENTDKTPEWYLILEALEIKVRPGDFSHEQYLNLTWDMVSYGQDEIQIQLYFEYPGRVSEWDVYDTVEVYFWEPDFFKS